MRKHILTLLIVFFALNCYSQIVYEKGYYISNSGEKVDCLILNVDWKNNPTSFKFKLDQESDVVEIGIKDIKEFGIYNISKYIKETVKIDRSSSTISNLNSDMNPSFREEQLFLKVIIAGEASLLVYQDKNNTRYFYQLGSSKPIQLIHKKYKDEQGAIQVNNQFREQLWSDLRCESITLEQLKKTDFYKKELTDIFVKYNTCKNASYSSFYQKRDLFNLNLRLGITNSSLLLQRNSLDFDFDKQSNIRFGIETEFILPFNKNKWALLFEPSYHSFKTEQAFVTNSTFLIEVNYQVIQLPIGIRHYFFLNNKSKVFINALFLFDLSFNSYIESNIAGSRFVEIEDKTSLALGIGYKYNDRLGLELRYQTGGDFLSRFDSWQSDYISTSLILGYTIF